MITTASPVLVSTSQTKLRPLLICRRRGRARSRCRTSSRRWRGCRCPCRSARPRDRRAAAGTPVLIRFGYALAEAEVAERQARPPRRAPRGAAPNGSTCTPSPSPRPRRCPACQPERRRGEMRDRLGHAEEHQADAHARAEHHRDPRDRPELRTVVVLAEADPTVGRDGQEHDEDQERSRGQDEQPAEVREHPAQDVPDNDGHVVLEQHADEHEHHRDTRGDDEDRHVDPRALLLHPVSSLGPAQGPWLTVGPVPAGPNIGADSTSSPGGTRLSPTIRSMTMF